VIGLKAVLLALATEAVLAIGLDVLVGTSVFWSVLISLPVAAFVLVWLSLPGAVEPSWHPLAEPTVTATHLEASTLASRLVDAAADPARFRGRVQPRLATIALARLRQLPDTHDLTDLRDPRAARALGADLHALVTSPTATLPDPARLAALLRELEEL
jgi:hypothetical protein